MPLENSEIVKELMPAMLLAVKSTAFKPSQPENGNCKSIFALAFVVALKRVESFIAPQ